MKKLILFALLSVPTGFASADTTPDELFTNPEPDTPADTSQTVSLDAFTGQAIRFFETFEADGYFVTGYKDSGELAHTPVNALNFGIGTDIRVDRTARAYASFYLPYPKPSATKSLYNPYDPPISTAVPDKLSFQNIEVKELFLDYSLGNLAIIRLGRQSATWGQGRLFNPGNLVEGIGNAMAVKVSTAVGPVALTSALIKNDDQYNVDSNNTKDSLSLGSLASAVLAEYSSEWFSTGASGFFHPGVGSKADVYIKTSFAGADLFLDGLGEIGTKGQQSWSGVVGLYNEFGPKPRWVKLQAEALLSGRGDTGSFKDVSEKNLGLTDWTLGVAATSELLDFMDTRPSLMWLHSLVDHSGQVVVGLVNTSLPHLELTAGVAHVYGSFNSRYIVNNPDPEDRRFLLTLKVAFLFDVNGK